MDIAAKWDPKTATPAQCETALRIIDGGNQNIKIYPYGPEGMVRVESGHAEASIMKVLNLAGLIPASKNKGSRLFLENPPGFDNSSKFEPSAYIVVADRLTLATAIDALAKNQGVQLNEGQAVDSPAR